MTIYKLAQSGPRDIFDNEYGTQEKLWYQKNILDSKTVTIWKSIESISAAILSEKLTSYFILKLLRQYRFVAIGLNYKTGITVIMAIVASFFFSL